jgi:hypothetical protein
VLKRLMAWTPARGEMTRFDTVEPSSTIRPTWVWHSNVLVGTSMAASWFAMARARQDESSTCTWRFQLVNSGAALVYAVHVVVVRFSRRPLVAFAGLARIPTLKHREDSAVHRRAIARLYLRN